MDIQKLVIEFYFNKRELSLEEEELLLDLPEDVYKMIIENEVERRKNELVRQKHHLYQIIDIRTNTVIYYGITNNPNSRENSHFSGKGFPLYDYMSEQGRDNFEFQILLSLETRGKIASLERQLISTTPGLLNLEFNSLDKAHPYLRGRVVKKGSKLSRPL